MNLITKNINLTTTLSFVFLFLALSGNVHAEKIHDTVKDPYIDAKEFEDILNTGEINKKNVNQLDTDGRTPLFYVLTVRGYSAYSFSKILLDNGASATLSDSEGKTPLHYASVHQYDSKLIKLLVQYGADPNAVDNDKNTPLHISSANGTVFAAKTLIHYGVNVNAVNNEGKTPLHLSAEKDFFSKYHTFQYLVKGGANIAAQDNYGNTPLHYTLMFKHEIRSVNYLLKESEKSIGRAKYLDIKNKNELTPCELLKTESIRRYGRNFFMMFQPKEYRQLCLF